MEAFIQALSIRPTPIGVSLVTPFVVLLDNHTTTRKGWKWDNTALSSITISNYNLTSIPFCLLFSGLIYGATLTDVGANGQYWTHTASSSSRAYLLSLNQSNIAPSHYADRLSGFSIRCLAR